MTVQTHVSQQTPAPTAAQQHLSDRIARVRPTDLHKVRIARYGRGAITRDDDGRTLVTAVLDTLALSVEPRQRMMNFLVLYCPWMSQADREQAISLSVSGRRLWSASALGDALKLTLEERSRLRISTIRAAGMTDADIAERRKVAARERSRKNRREASLHPKQQEPLPAIRARAIADLLRPGECCAVKAVCKHLRKHVRFGGLSERALAAAVHDAIKHGVSRGFLRKDLEKGAKGWPVAKVTRIGEVR